MSGRDPDRSPAAARAERGLTDSRVPQLGDWGLPSFQRAFRELGLRPDAAQGLRRADWEKAAALLVLEETGSLQRDARVLFVAAGVDPLYGWLSGRVRQVLVTDEYRGGWSDSPRDFPSHPERFLELPFDRSRLSIARMDARALGLRDASFDVVLCLGPSISWFGGWTGAQAALREMRRVLTPGGLVIASVEFDLLQRKAGGFRFDRPGSAPLVWASRAGERALSRGRQRLHLADRGEVQSLLSSSGLSVLGEIRLESGDLVSSEGVAGWVRRPEAPAGGSDIAIRRRHLTGGFLSPYRSVPLLLVLRRAASADAVPVQTPASPPAPR